jgi:Domain of unknown function (DUF4268)
MRLELGTLSKLDPHALFSGEKSALTAWLAENLPVVGAAVGMDLELVHRNGTSGGSSADIIARDTAGDRIVVIESDLDSPNDSHLGKLISCAGGQDARVVVWVSPEFREQHCRAVEWLNRSGGASQFYALSLALFRIDDSKPGVALKLVAAPNGCSTAPNVASPVGAGGIPEAGVMAAGDPVARDRQQAYHKFFQQLVDVLRDKYRFTNARQGQPQNWYTFASGVRGVVYSIWFSAAGYVRCELYIDVGDRDLNRAIFERLRQEKNEIEKDFGDALQWDSFETRRACSVGASLSGEIDDPPEVVQTLLNWAVDRLLRFKKVFGPRLPRVTRSLVPASQG